MRNITTTLLQRPRQLGLDAWRSQNYTLRPSRLQPITGIRYYCHLVQEYQSLLPLTWHHSSTSGRAELQALILTLPAAMPLRCSCTTVWKALMFQTRLSWCAQRWSETGQYSARTGWTCLAGGQTVPGCHLHSSSPGQSMRRVPRSTWYGDADVLPWHIRAHQWSSNEAWNDGRAWQDGDVAVYTSQATLLEGDYDAWSHPGRSWYIWTR